jgi:hypothetical protein
LRVDTLISIRFIAQRPSQSSPAPPSGLTMPSPRRRSCAHAADAPPHYRRGSRSCRRFDPSGDRAGRRCEGWLEDRAERCKVHHAAE